MFSLFFLQKVTIVSFFVFEYLLDPKHGMITFLFVIYCPLSYRDNRETTKVVFQLLLKRHRQPGSTKLRTTTTAHLKEICFKNTEHHALVSSTPSNLIQYSFSHDLLP